MKRDYKDPQYELFRKKVLRRDRYRCKICKSRTKLRVHHLDSWDWFPAGRFEIKNGICLCAEHHDDFHKCYGKGGNSVFQFDEYLSKYHNTSIMKLLPSRFKDPKKK